MKGACADASSAVQSWSVHVLRIWDTANEPLVKGWVYSRVLGTDRPEKDLGAADGKRGACGECDPESLFYNGDYFFVLLCFVSKQRLGAFSRMAHL